MRVFKTHKTLQLTDLKSLSHIHINYNTNLIRTFVKNSLRLIKNIFLIFTVIPFFYLKREIG